MVAEMAADIVWVEDWKEGNIHLSHQQEEENQRRVDVFKDRSKVNFWEL